MRVEVARTPKALLATEGMAVEVGILTFVATTCVCLCFWLSFSFLCRLDVLEQSVVLGEVCEDVTLLWSSLSVLSKDLVALHQRTLI